MHDLFLGQGLDHNTGLYYWQDLRLQKPCIVKYKDEKILVKMITMTNDDYHLRVGEGLSAHDKDQ